MTGNKPEMKSDRQKDLADARILLNKLSCRVNSERFREYETDNTYLKFCRAYTQHLLAVNQLQKDQELEEIEARLSELEAQAAKESENVS